MVIRLPDLRVPGVQYFLRERHSRLALVASCDAAMSDDLIGQATVVDGDTIEIHGNAFAFGVSTRQRARSSAEVRTAISIDAGRTLPTISTAAC
jgi:hypothetical protein